MKKKVFILLAIFINISYFCLAQADGGPKAEEVQVKYFTKELGLSPDESSRFWPVYNNYRNEVANARKENKDDQVKMEEKVVSIRKKYKNDFKGVLGNDDRVNKLFVVEKNFHEMLREELLRRRNQ